MPNDEKVITEIVKTTKYSALLHHLLKFTFSLDISFFVFFFILSVSVSVRMNGISDRIWLRVHVLRRSELAVGSAGSCHYTASTPETPLNSQPPQTKTLPVSLSFFVAGSRNLDWIRVTSHKNKRKKRKKKKRSFKRKEILLLSSSSSLSALFVSIPKPQYVS
jgi:hypothetical protein